MVIIGSYATLGSWLAPLLTLTWSVALFLTRRCALSRAPRLDGADWPSAADALIAVVTNRLHSDVSRRGYRTALRQFLAWHR